MASAMGALFLSQLEQFVLTTGLNTAVENLIEAGVLALGIAIYTVRWSLVREWFRHASIGGWRGGAAPAGSPRARQEHPSETHPIS
jgi:ribose transport system permease protein